jgi:serine/threonine protein kinase
MMPGDLRGQHLGKYQIVELIGRGEMAAVYRAFEPALRRYVAIKVMSADLTRVEGFQTRFEHLVQTVACLDHPNILPIYDYGEAGDVPYLVMPLITDGTLREWLARSGHPPLALTVPLLRGALSALEYAHQRGVLHGAIRPSNILMRQGSWPLLTDFGLTELLEPAAGDTPSHPIVAVPEYMAPEQSEGGHVSRHADLYAMGIVLFQLLTGHVPFQGPTDLATVMAHLQEPVPSPRRYNPELSAAWDEVIQRALAKDPDDRYPSAQTMEAAIQTAWERAQGGAVASYAGGPVESAPRVDASPPVGGAFTGAEAPQVVSPPSTPTSAHTTLAPRGTSPPTDPVAAPPAAPPPLDERATAAQLLERLAARPPAAPAARALLPPPPPAPPSGPATLGGAPLPPQMDRPPNTVATPLYELVAQTGPRAGETFRLEGTTVHVGRRQSNNLVLPDEQVSRQHARLEPRADGVLVVDEGSSNGTQVNGASIAAPTYLRPGDVLEVGASRFLLREAPPAQASPETPAADAEVPAPPSPAAASEARNPVGSGERPRAVGRGLAGVVGSLLSPLARVPATVVRAIPRRRAQVDLVDCTVFAPPIVAQGATVLVQVFAHLPAQAAAAAEMAARADPAAVWRGYTSLQTEIERGWTLMFHLSLPPDLAIDDPIKSLVWRGRPQAVQFSVSVPPGRAPGVVAGTVTVSLNGLPVGHVVFQVAITSADQQPTSPAAEPLGAAHYYQKAFISYASKDRDEVLKYAGLLDVLHIPFFQDVLHLAPGERWERALYRHIDESDLFLVFWSTAAKESAWVQQEIQYALRRKGDDDAAPPAIVPVPIEGPPPVEPPAELAHLHFDHPIRYVRRQPGR